MALIHSLYYSPISQAYRVEIRDEAEFNPIYLDGWQELKIHWEKTNVEDQLTIHFKKIYPSIITNMNWFRYPSFSSNLALTTCGINVTTSKIHVSLCEPWGSSTCNEPTHEKKRIIMGSGGKYSPKKEGIQHKKVVKNCGWTPFFSHWHPIYFFIFTRRFFALLTRFFSWFLSYLCPNN